MWRDIQSFFNEQTDLANQWLGFVRSTLKAHLEVLVVSLGRLLEAPQGSSSGVSVGYLLNVAKGDLRSCPKLKPKELARLIEADIASLEILREEYRQVIRWRHELIAHLDKDQVRSPTGFSATTKELMHLVKSLHEIVNRYSLLFFDTQLKCGTARSGDFAKVACALIIGDRERKRLLFEAEDAARGKSPTFDPFENLDIPIWRTPPEWEWNGL